MKQTTPKNMQSDMIPQFVHHFFQSLHGHYAEAIGGVVGVFFIKLNVAAIISGNSEVVHYSIIAFAWIIKGILGGLGGIVAKIVFHGLKSIINKIKSKL